MYRIQIKALFVYLFVVAALAACSKDINTVPDVAYEGAPMVNFNNYYDDDGMAGYTKYEAELKDSFFTANIEVKLTNTTETAKQNIKVYLVKNDALVFDYNTKHGTTLLPLPVTSTAWSLDFTQPVIIKKGERKATIPIMINPLKFDLAKQNALGIAIDRVEGAALNTGDESALVIEFGARNRYDGYYATKGSAFHPSYSTYTWNSQGVFECGEGFALVTSGPNSVDLNPGQPLFTAGSLTYFAAVVPRFTVNPQTNKVTISSTIPTTVFVQYPTYDSRYDPATKSFYIKYGWSGDRVATDTFTYCGPR
ncbi:DUF1735 domain-containing protein [Segetibacter sp. 3557_3]|uniref:DUF1735 domain-containing protein n=1 Tax=Segetibacter sp. 3557_3 TaxID=2547429 RepID=UPI001058A0E7|nr:DUF1735 domain-containing protein [Segetibacter sp. 3557_3]TDH21312.1 DUF1735 domain-containing protein [Segetibacter sp. 3557_3]